MSDVKMADLEGGIRIHHVRWRVTGTIRADGVMVSVVWDESLIETQISEDGPVWPEDVEILAEGAGS